MVTPPYPLAGAVIGAQIGAKYHKKQNPNTSYLMAVMLTLMGLRFILRAIFKYNAHKRAKFIFY